MVVEINAVKVVKVVNVKFLVKVLRLNLKELG